MKRHCHNARDKFCRHYESKIGFLHGQIESKMTQNRGISAAHTCTTYYRQCLPRVLCYLKQITSTLYPMCFSTFYPVCCSTLYPLCFREFYETFIELLRRRFGTKRVQANNVYQEYISDRDHVHMNSTQWETLTDFVKWLGREGKGLNTTAGYTVLHSYFHVSQRPWNKVHFSLLYSGHWLALFVAICTVLYALLLCVYHSAPVIINPQFSCSCSLCTITPFSICLKVTVM